MSNAVPSLLLVGMKQEEVSSEEDCVLGPDKVCFYRQDLCTRHILQNEIESMKSDCASGGDKWQPSPQSPAFSTLFNEVKTPLLLPSPASSIPTDQLKPMNRLSPSIDMISAEEVLTPTTSEINQVRDEPEYHSSMERTDESEGERLSQRLRPFACEICGRGFLRLSHKKSHVKNVHKDSPLQSLACEICGRTFQRISNLKQHIDFIHKRLRPFICEICGENFGELGNLTRHVDFIHKKLRQFVCEFCGRAFATSSHRQMHIVAIHEGLRPYSCELCGRTFADPAHLRRHMHFLHEEPVKRVCSACDAVFSRNGDLKKHMDAVHAELRPFVCEFCGNNFKRSSAMKSHIYYCHKDRRPEKAHNATTGDRRPEEANNATPGHLKPEDLPDATPGVSAQNYYCSGMNPSP